MPCFIKYIEMDTYLSGPERAGNLHFHECFTRPVASLCNFNSVLHPYCSVVPSLLPPQPQPTSAPSPPRTCSAGASCPPEMSALPRLRPSPGAQQVGAIIYESVRACVHAYVHVSLAVPCTTGTSDCLYNPTSEFEYVKGHAKRAGEHTSFRAFARKLAVRAPSVSPEFFVVLLSSSFLVVLFSPHTGCSTAGRPTSQGTRGFASLGAIKKYGRNLSLCGKSELPFFSVLRSAAARETMRILHVKCSDTLFATEVVR